MQLANLKFIVYLFTVYGAATLFNWVKLFSKVITWSVLRINVVTVEELLRQLKTKVIFPSHSLPVCLLPVTCPALCSSNKSANLRLTSCVRRYPARLSSSVGSASLSPGVSLPRLSLRSGTISNPRMITSGLSLLPRFLKALRIARSPRQSNVAGSWLQFSNWPLARHSAQSRQSKQRIAALWNGRHMLAKRLWIN